MFIFLDKFYLNIDLFCIYDLRKTVIYDSISIFVSIIKNRNLFDISTIYNENYNENSL